MVVDRFCLYLTPACRGRGGGRGGRGGFDQGPPERVVPLGTFSHACQEDLVVKSGIRDVPYFNAPIYLENIEQVLFNAII